MKDGDGIAQTTQKSAIRRRSKTREQMSKGANCQLGFIADAEAPQRHRVAQGPKKTQSATRCGGGGGYPAPLQDRKISIATGSLCMWDVADAALVDSRYKCFRYDG
jgi:hypothetical protein